MSTDMTTEIPTFGVEVEFVVASLPEGDEDPHKNVEGLPPVLYIPPGEMSTDDGKRFTYKHVKAVLDEYFGTDPPVVKINDNKYEGWNVESDISIRQKPGDDYVFVGVEINSPVLYASTKGFDAVKLAVSLITSKFRCFVNITCGLHVHVGLGRNKLPLEHIRRLASLSYAIEPLLYTLNHPVRRVNSNSRTLRYHSVLARGIKEDIHTNPDALNTKFHHYIGRSRRHGEYPYSKSEEYGEIDEANVNNFLATRQPGHFEPFVKSGEPEQPQVSGDLSHIVHLAMPPDTLPRKRHIPRLRWPRYDLQRLHELDDLLAANDVFGEIKLSEESTKSGPSVFEVTRWIYAQPASCYIAQQLSLPTPHHLWRLATSFSGYRCDSVANPKRFLRTIEFRLGDGSLDAEWVSTWAKICTGIFKFAIYSSVSDFASVLANCDRASTEDGSYDVVDLLDEMGLFAEAERAEKRLMAHKDQWKLEFVNEAPEASS
ncbi:putative amidoligase enzyme-domain-containing protein [Nemania sp. FL0031]|nr:putative amidoligase enzyme-domain-containing protein [Nemania sp. FL0031]